jgi:hypothetical protein
VHVTAHKREIHPDDVKYLQFRTAQHEGLEEERIARKFDYPTPKALYAKLAEDGYPVCKDCGAHTKNHPPHRERPEDRPPKKERKAKAAGDREAVELPPARAAAPLFEDMINPAGAHASSLYPRPPIEDPDDPRYSRSLWRLLRATLRDYIVDLEYLEEELHGGNRFFSTSIEEVFDMDTEPYTATLPGGGRPYPNPRLVVLIATYALLYGKVGPLLKVLHPEPASIDQDSLDKINRVVKALHTQARQLAQWVRGGVVKQSPPTAELSLTEQQDAWEINRLKEQGLSAEEIRKEMSRLSVEEIKRLGAFNLRRPNP